MGCQVIKDPNLGVMFLCSRGRQARAKCFYCGQLANLLCDYPVDKTVNKSGACDKNICSNCSIKVGNDVDHCKAHSTNLVGTITIGNYKLGDRGIYIGRAMPSYGLKQSPLANQWKLGSLASSEEILTNYRRWLWEEIKAKGKTWLELQRIVKLVMSGQNVKLICWCKNPASGKDNPCHGDIVKAALEWMIREIQNKRMEL